MILHFISAATGAATILISLWLVAKKRITLDQICAGRELGQEAVRAEIFKLIRISSNVPAIALFVVGLVLIIVPIYLGGADTPIYRVAGQIKKADGGSSRDVSVHTRYPPFFPTSQGGLVGLKVWRGPNGMLPTISFVHPDYATTAVDLNDMQKVRIRGDEIRLREPVELLPLPEGGT